jgi:hypothetical protein
MAYADAFLALMVACLVAACLVPLMRKVETVATPTPNAH